MEVLDAALGRFSLLARLRRSGQNGRCNLGAPLRAEANLNGGTDANRSLALGGRAQHERHLATIPAGPRDDEPRRIDRLHDTAQRVARHGCRRLGGLCLCVR
jgi:hypothetical protein